MFNNFKNILVLAPHADDGELGCGGFISKSINQLKSNILKLLVLLFLFGIKKKLIS